MRQRIYKYLISLTAVSTLALAACSEAPDQTAASDAVESSAGYESPAMQAEAVADASTATGASGAVPGLSALEVSMPKLAYTYAYAFRTSGERLGDLQRRHADLCEQQGPMSCRILGMSKSGEDAEEVTGELQLAVATQHARAFGALLEKEAESAEAQQLSAEIATEEMSKAIVDTEAQLRARTELRDRLMDVLRTRKGSVEELVAAERSVAQVNQEIDQARSWLREMQGRVAFSRIDVRYESGAPVANDFLAPIQAVVGSLGGILGFVFAMLIALAAVLGPIAGLIWLGRRIGRTAEIA